MARKRACPVAVGNSNGTHPIAVGKQPFQICPEAAGTAEGIRLTVWLLSLLNQKL